MLFFCCFGFLVTHSALPARTAIDFFGQSPLLGSDEGFPGERWSWEDALCEGCGDFGKLRVGMGGPFLCEVVAILSIWVVL